MLWRYSQLERVRKCRRVPRRKGHGALIAYRADDERAHYAGLVTCGSVWACPMCAARILAGRTSELVEAIENHTAAGGTVAMITLTMRHDAGQGLAELWDALAEAWRAGTSGSRSVRPMLKGVPWARRVEVTHGQNGWHVHVHALLFLPGNQALDVEQLGNAMFAAWSARLQSLGYAAPLQGPGVDARLLDLSTARQAVGEYLAKGEYRTASERAALEIAGLKKARGSNRTPFEILADFVATGEAGDGTLWSEWERVSKGRRAHTWSRGARAKLAPGPEVTDDELAAQSDAQGEPLVRLGSDTWAAIASQRGLPVVVLQVAEQYASNRKSLVFALRHRLREAGIEHPKVAAVWPGKDP